MQTIRDSFTPYRRTNSKDVFQPYSPAPEKIKALTDKTKALYEDLLRMKRNIVMERIKLREGKLLALVEHELKHYFGKPYENNYYTGMTCRCHSFIHSSIYPSIRPSVRRSVHPSIYSSVRPSIRPSFHPSVRPSVHSYILPSIHPSIHLSVRPFICSSVLPPVRPPLPLSLSFLPSVRPSVCSTVRLSLCPSVHSFLRLLIHPRILYTFVRSLLRFSVTASIFPYVCPCASDWSCPLGHLLQPIRSTSQICSDT